MTSSSLYLINIKVSLTCSNTSSNYFGTGRRNFSELSAIADINLFTLAEFLQALHDHDLQLLVCLYLPDCFKWKETLDFSSFFLSLKKLGSSVKLECTRNWGKAFRLWKSKEALLKQIATGGDSVCT